MTINKESENIAATLAMTSACSFTRISRHTAPWVEAAAQCNGVCNTHEIHPHITLNGSLMISSISYIYPQME